MNTPEDVDPLLMRHYGEQTQTIKGGNTSRSTEALQDSVIYIDHMRSGSNS